MSHIEVTDLSKVFGKKPRSMLAHLRAGKSREQIRKKYRHLVAVNQVNLTFNKGETTVVIGLSGSGKSTLLRCLNRLIEPTDGTIKVDGQEITQLSKKDLRILRQRTFGMVFQQFALLPHYSVLGNTAFGLELMGVAPAERNKKALEALEQVGLANRANAMVHELSGGMQQRVGLARALAMDTPVLLMDEPFSALDPLTRREMQSELLRLQYDLQKTIIFISHDLDEALSLGNKIVLMRDGRVVQEGTAEDILSNPADEHVSEFVRYADRGKIFSAGSIMIPAKAELTMGLDGPNTALRKMQYHNISSLFVVDALRTLRGIVYADDVLRLKQEGGRDLAAIMQTDIISAQLGDPLKQIIPSMASLPYPLPVVDEHNRLQGVIVRGLLLGALASDASSDGDTPPDGPNPEDNAEPTAGPGSHVDSPVDSQANGLLAGHKQLNGEVTS